MHSSIHLWRFFHEAWSSRLMLSVCLLTMCSFTQCVNFTPRGKPRAMKFMPYLKGPSAGFRLISGSLFTFISFCRITLFVNFTFLCFIFHLHWLHCSYQQLISTLLAVVHLISSPLCHSPLLPLSLSPIYMLFFLLLSFLLLFFLYFIPFSFDFIFSLFFLASFSGFCIVLFLLYSNHYNNYRWVLLWKS